ncbi:MAG: SDR family NAD(P)-dependent oxidoreductase [Thermomicrobiales bacterium]
MVGRLTDKVALVTGGGGGIGEATARLFWEEGAAIAIVDLNGDAGTIAANGIDPSGERIVAIQADLTSEAEAERAVNETVARFGKLDVLANIAAVRVQGPVTEATAESWDFVIRVNLLAVAYGCKYAIPIMAKNGGEVSSPFPRRTPRWGGPTWGSTTPPRTPCWLSPARWPATMPIRASG